LRVAPEIGDLIPAEPTAAGRLYRVFAEDFDDTLPEADPEDLRVARRGYATNCDAWIEGLSVLAVPIWQDRSGGRPDLIGTLALGAASPRFSEIGEQTVAKRLIAAAAAVTQRLGVPSPRARPRLSSRTKPQRSSRATPQRSNSRRPSTSRPLATGRPKQPRS
jgi:DNA-binding IclR family transcriptional regulator